MATCSWWQYRSSVSFVGPRALFTSDRSKVISLAAEHKIPAIYNTREFTLDGGLISYGPSQGDAFRLAGGYVANILKGTKPTDLPIQQAIRFELVINLDTAKVLGLTIPPTLLGRADEVIE